MIELRDVCYGYDGNEVFRNLTLTIAKGEFAVLVGATGSGKSTLMKLLTGELLPDAGEIIVDHTLVHRLRKGQLARYRRSIGSVLEERSLLEDRTVAENVALALEIGGSMRPERIRESVMTSLRNAGLIDRAGILPNRLSLGERQRAAIARALVREPLLLVADNPTAQLDRESACKVIAMLASENIRGMTILVTMSEVACLDLLQRQTSFYRFSDGGVQRFLPETEE